MPYTTNAQATTTTTTLADLQSAVSDATNAMQAATGTNDAATIGTAFMALGSAQAALNAHTTQLEATAIQATNTAIQAAAALEAVEANVNAPFDTKARTAAVLGNADTMDATEDTDGVWDTTKTYMKPALKAVVLDSTTTMAATLVQSCGLVLRTVDGVHAVYDKCGSGLEVASEFGSVVGALAINAAHKANDALDNSAKKSKVKSALATIKMEAKLQAELQREANKNPALFDSYARIASDNGLTITKPTESATPVALQSAPIANTGIASGIDLNVVLGNTPAPKV